MEPPHPLRRWRVAQGSTAPTSSALKPGTRVQTVVAKEPHPFDFTHPETKAPLNTILLTGGNGSGKSSVIQALCGVWDRLDGRFRADSLEPGDIRRGTDRAEIHVALVEAGMEQDVAPITFSAVRSLKAPGPGLNFVPRITRWIDKLQRTDLAVGKMIALDVYRLLPATQVDGPSVAQVARDVISGALTPTLRRDGRLERRFGQLKQWIVNLDFQRAKAKADRGEDLPMWQRLVESLNLMLPPFRFERVDDSFDVWFTAPTGSVPLESLSDGLRSVFVIVTELLFRLSMITPEPAKVLEQEMVCLIDEIDAHLHPRWQLTVVPALTHLFPNVQFIMTTHSPLVVSTVQPFQVFRLDAEGG